MLRVIIIDDEQNTRDVISVIVAKHFQDVKIVAEADNVRSGIEAISKHKPDLVLLDIHLQDGSGFDVIREITYTGFKIVFITAYEEYAVKAFKCSALDYILKPINSDELVAAVRKAANGMPTPAELGWNTFNTAYSSKGTKRIVLKTADSIYAISVNEIVRCKADTYYTTFYLADRQSITVSGTLKDFDDMLGEFGFVRVHQSHLINLDYFARYKRSDGGSAVMKDGTEIPVAVRKKELLMRAISRL